MVTIRVSISSSICHGFDYAVSFVSLPYSAISESVISSAHIALLVTTCFNPDVLHSCLQYLTVFLVPCVDF
jgi:Fe-S cluster assembly iron-binding protein IscA